MPPPSTSPRGTSPASSRPRSRRNSNGSLEKEQPRSSSPNAGNLLVGVTGYSNRFIAAQTVHAANTASAQKASQHAPREYNPEDGFDKYATDGNSYPSIPNSRSNSPNNNNNQRSGSPTKLSPVSSGRTSPSLLTPANSIDTTALLAPPPPPPSYPPPPQAQVLSTAAAHNAYKPRPLDNNSTNPSNTSAMLTPLIQMLNQDNDNSNNDTEGLLNQFVSTTIVPPPPPSGPVPAEALRLPNLPLPTVHESTEVNSTIAQTPIESGRGGAGTPEIPPREPLAVLHENIQEALDESTDSKALAAAAALRRAEARRVAALGDTVTTNTTNSVSHTPASRMSFTEGSLSNNNNYIEEIKQLQQQLSVQQELHEQALAKAIEEATNNAKAAAEVAYSTELEQYRHRMENEMDTLRQEHTEELTRLRTRYETDVADMARKPSKAQLDHYRTLSEEHLQLQAEKARLFVSEATARRELETLRSNIDIERQQALSRENSLKVDLEAAKQDNEHLHGRIRALENDIAAIKTRAHETLTHETNKHEQEIDNLTRAHTAEVQALRTSMRMAAAQAAKDAGFKELHSPTKGLVVRVNDITSSDAGNNKNKTDTDLSYADILEALASEVATLRTALTDTSKDARKASTEARKNDAKLAELQAETSHLRAERTAWMQQVQKENEQVQALVQEVRTEKNRLSSELTSIAEERASLEAVKRAYDARESILINVLHDHGIPLPNTLPPVNNKPNNKSKAAAEAVSQLRELANKVDSVPIPPVPTNRPPTLPNSNTVPNSAFGQPRGKR